MSQNSVVIKSNKYGIAVILDAAVTYEQLLEDVKEKFMQSAKFFKNAQMAVSFEGRQLTLEQEQELVAIITQNSELDIVCIVDQDKEREMLFQKSFEEKLQEVQTQGGQFYKGTLRSGQCLEAESSIIVLGDVNPGANIISTGNIIVLGSLKGTVYAGGNGNISAFVVALDMDPMQIRIGDVIARSADKSEKKTKRLRLKKSAADTMEPQIAFVEDGNIYIEPINKGVLQDMPL